MKDLKHLYYFEQLLEDADNELVRRAKQEGRKCIGSICYQVPEVLLDLPGVFPVRLRAPRTGSIEMGTFYMTSLLCEYSRALLERAIEGGFQFLDCLIAPDGCTMINRCVENMELLKTMSGEDFFFRYLEVPMKADDNGLNLYVSECRTKVLGSLSEKFGIDTSDAALRKAVEEHNKLCRLITKIGSSSFAIVASISLTPICKEKADMGVCSDKLAKRFPCKEPETVRFSQSIVMVSPARTPQERIRLAPVVWFVIMMPFSQSTACFAEISIIGITGTLPLFTILASLILWEKAVGNVKGEVRRATFFATAATFSVTSSKYGLSQTNCTVKGTKHPCRFWGVKLVQRHWICRLPRKPVTVSVPWAEKTAAARTSSRPVGSPISPDAVIVRGRIKISVTVCPGSLA